MISPYHGFLNLIFGRFLLFDPTVQQRSVCNSRFLDRNGRAATPIVVATNARVDHSRENSTVVLISACM